MDITAYEKQLKSVWNRKSALTFIGYVKQKNYFLSFSHFSGVSTLCRIYRKTPFLITVSFEISSGEAALVAVQSNQITRLEIGRNELAPGKYRIRIVGKASTGKLELK